MSWPLFPHFYIPLEFFIIKRTSTCHDLIFFKNKNNFHSIKLSSTTIYTRLLNIFSLSQKVHCSLEYNFFNKFSLHCSYSVPRYLCMNMATTHAAATPAINCNAPKQAEAEQSTGFFVSVWHFSFCSSIKICLQRHSALQNAFSPLRQHCHQTNHVK